MGFLKPNSVIIIFLILEFYDKPLSQCVLFVKHHSQALVMVMAKPGRVLPPAETHLPIGPKVGPYP